MINPHFTMPKVRVLAADATKARWFTVETPDGDLIETSTTTNPQGRQHERNLTSAEKDLVTDRPGRMHDDGVGQRSGVKEASSTPKQEQIDRFAWELAKTLDSERTSGQLERLYVVAPPTFLGRLRKHMSADLKKMVVEEVGKDLVVRKPEEIRKHLPTWLK